MTDVYVVLGLALFSLLSWGLVVLCDRLMGGRR